MSRSILLIENLFSLNIVKVLNGESKEDKMDKEMIKQKVKVFEERNFKKLFNHYEERFEEYILSPVAITLTRGCSVTMIICCF